MKRLAVFVSGNGSNLQAILDAIAAGELPGACVAVVVSNRKDAYGIQRAEQAGVPVIYHPLLPYRRAGKSREEYDADLAALLAPYHIDLVVLAGWMHILSLAFLRRFPRVLNIHPALPGAFPGAHAISDAWRAFQRGEIDHTGVMVHLAPDEGVDSGPVVCQQAVPILPDDTLETLEERIHAVEHRLYVQAIARVLALEET